MRRKVPFLENIHLEGEGENTLICLATWMKGWPRGLPWKKDKNISRPIFYT